VNNNDKTVRIPTLDGVRGVAVLLILFHHLVLASGIDQIFWWDRQVFKLADASWLGVDLFFVLSGFLITSILFDTKDCQRYFRNFYGRRVLRIFPLYYGYLALALLLFPLWLPPEQSQSLIETQHWYWLYLSNFHVALDGWPESQVVGHFWTLAIEEQFYLLWPLAVWALTRRQLLYVASACFLGALTLRIVMPSAHDIYVLLPTRMDSLAAGAFLAVVVRGENGIAVLGKWPIILFSACSAMLLAIYLKTGGWFGYNDHLISIIGYTIISLAFASLIALLLTAKPPSLLGRIFSGKSLAFLGKYSYGIYVFHVPVIWALESNGLQAGLFPRQWGSSLPGVLVFSIFGGGISVLCALASYHLWEVRFLRLKRYLPYPRPGSNHIEAVQAKPKVRLPSLSAARVYAASLFVAVPGLLAHNPANDDTKTQDINDIVWPES
jgi:peptidoglycan/LPS O-acetylase OafA/YrhL